MKIKLKKLTAFLLVAVMLTLCVGNFAIRALNEKNEHSEIDPPKPGQKPSYDPNKLFNDRFQGLRLYVTDSGGGLIGQVHDYMYNNNTATLTLSGSTGSCYVRVNDQLGSIVKGSVEDIGIPNDSDNYPVCSLSSNKRKNGTQLAIKLGSAERNPAPDGRCWAAYLLNNLLGISSETFVDGGYHLFIENTFFIRVYENNVYKGNFYGSAYEWARYCKIHNVNIPKDMKTSARYTNNYLATSLQLRDSVLGIAAPNSVPTNVIMTSNQILSAGYGTNELSMYIASPIPPSTDDDKTEDHGKSLYLTLTMPKEYETGYIASEGMYNLHDGIPTLERIDNHIEIVNRAGEVEYGKYWAKRQYLVNYTLKYKQKEYRDKKDSDGNTLYNEDGTVQKEEYTVIKQMEGTRITEKQGIYYYVRDYALYEADMFWTGNQACDLTYQSINGIDNESVKFRISGEMNPVDIPTDPEDGTPFTKEQYHIDWSECEDKDITYETIFDSADAATSWLNSDAAQLDADKRVKCPKVKSDYVEVEGRVYLEEEEVQAPNSENTSEAKKPLPEVFTPTYIEKETLEVPVPYDLLNGYYYTPVSVGYLIVAGTLFKDGEPYHPVYITEDWQGSDSDKSHILDGGGTLKDGTYNSYVDNCPIHVITPVISPFTLYEYNGEELPTNYSEIKPFVDSLDKVPGHIKQLTDEEKELLSEEQLKKYEWECEHYGTQLAVPYCLNCEHEGYDITYNGGKCPECNSTNTSRYCSNCFKLYTVSQVNNIRTNMGNICPNCGFDLAVLNGRENGDLKQLRLDNTYFLNFNPYYNHLDYLGYNYSDKIDNDNDWHGRGAYFTDNKFDKYVLEKWIKFPFDVYIDDILFEAGEWVEVYEYDPALDETTPGYTDDNHLVTTKFYIPPWAGEVCDEMEVLVKAINYDGRDVSGVWYHNENDPEYWAMYTVGVQTSGWLYDMEGVGTYPATAWKEKTDDTIQSQFISLASDKHELFQGEYNRKGDGSYRNMYDYDDKYQRFWLDDTVTDSIERTLSDNARTLPFSDGKAVTTFADGSLVLDSNLAFTINSISNLTENDYIEIKPTFTWYDEKAENSLSNDEIFLYYSDEDKLFIPYDSDRDKENAQRLSLSSEELTDTVDEADVEYMAKKNLGYLDKNALNASEKKKLRKEINNIKQRSSSATFGQGRLKILGNELMLYNTDMLKELERNLMKTENYITDILGYDFKWFKYRTEEKKSFSGDALKEMRQTITQSGQTWYGVYNIPGNLYIVDKEKLAKACRDLGLTVTAKELDINTALADYAREASGIDGTESFVIKKGVLKVNFEITVYKNGQRWLQYFKETTSDQWQMEGMAEDCMVWTPMSINKLRQAYDEASASGHAVDPKDGFYHIPVESGDVAIVKINPYCDDSRNAIETSLIFSN